MYTVESTDIYRYSNVVSTSKKALFKYRYLKPTKVAIYFISAAKYPYCTTPYPCLSQRKCKRKKKPQLCQKAFPWVWDTCAGDSFEARRPDGWWRLAHAVSVAPGT